jgi:ribonucleoside-diphosphate reductase beta chain
MSKRELKCKVLYNQDSNEKYGEERIINGNPMGIINPNQSKHKWAYEIYLMMRNLTWFPEQINLTKDRTAYTELTEKERKAYDLILAQLITNDSIQTNQLIDKYNVHITSPVVNMALAKQAEVEALHSDSYAKMVQDISVDTEKIYYLHKHDKELHAKNQAIADMYKTAYTDDCYYNPTPEDMAVAACANQCLEENVFPGGFAGMYVLGEKMIGSAEMIAEINADETFTHVPLFKHIFRAIIDEEFNGKITAEVEDRCYKMVQDITEAELRWSKYIGIEYELNMFTDYTIEAFIYGQANSICKNLRLKPLYKDYDVNPLRDLMMEKAKGGLNKRTNFFERNVTEYNKIGVDIDW